MKNHRSVSKGLLLGASLLFVFAFLVAFAPAQAASIVNTTVAYQVQVTPPVVEVTAVVPETGSPAADPNFLASWIFWVILGALVIGLLIALASRGSSTTTVIHHDDDNL